jgi:hypothetical protein
MKSVIGIMLAVIVVGGVAALLLAYKYYRQNKVISILRAEVKNRDQILSSINKSFDKQLLFIHHSVGSLWLDEGGLRAELIKRGFGVHDATYGDKIGEYTDMCDWAEKFANHMNEILKFDYHPDTYYNEAAENNIIMFKSCFPNSQIIEEGIPPGDVGSKTRSLWNYKATMDSLKSIFARYPQKTFIFVTAPPLVPNQTTLDDAKRAKEFSDWVKGPFIENYKSETGLGNFYIFDLFNILSDQSNCLNAEYRINDNDSHPNARGLKKATNEFIAFLQNIG